MTKNWLLEMVEWAQQLGLEQKSVWIDFYHRSSSPMMRRHQSRRLLYGEAAWLTSTQGVRLELLGTTGEGIRSGWLPREVACLAFRMARVAQVVGAVYGHLDDRLLPRHILLVLAIALRLPNLRTGVLRIAQRSFLGDLIATVGLPSPEVIAAEVAAELIRRHQAVQMQAGSYSFAIEDAMHMLLLDVTALAGAAFFEDMAFSDADLAELDTRILARAQLMLWLVIEMARAASLSGPEVTTFMRRLAAFLHLPDTEREALLRLPDGIDWDAYNTYFATPEEKRGVIECLLALALLDDQNGPAERHFIERTANALNLKQYDLYEVEQRVRDALAGRGVV